MTLGEILHGLRPLIADAFQVEEARVVSTATLRGDLGGKAIEFAQLLTDIEDAFGVRAALLLTNGSAQYADVTVADLAAAILALVPRQQMEIA
ncbi:MAG TPA: phosphopantetheine-binding protein [Azospirillum sp.]|nr:phosphopantetheine-binding protein [Azospirillum sp.]